MPGTTELASQIARAALTRRLRAAMTRRLRATGRVVRTVLHALHGLAVAVVLFPRLDPDARRERVRWWSRKLFDVLDIALRVDGVAHPEARLLVANHVSWLDIAAIHAVAPHARFVSKADVKRWPLLNRLIDAGGTLYIERERVRDAMRVVHQMAESMQRGETVAIFPEGTTSDGTGVLPFHANLLQAAVSTRACVQPVALRFSDAAHAVSPAPAYTADATLARSLWAVACTDGLQARVAFVAPVQAGDLSRRALAERLREAIVQAL